MNESAPIPNTISFLNAMPVGAGLDAESLREALHFSTAWPFQHTLVGNGSQRHDTWSLVQYGLSQDPLFSPLVAINPLGEHPVTCARRVLTLTLLYGPRIALNLIPGAYFAEMSALGDNSNQADRLRRAREFYVVVGELLRTGRWEPKAMEFFSFERISLGLKPLVELPKLYVSGTKWRPLELAGGWQPRLVTNLRPLASTQPAPPGVTHGLRVGICARASHEEALAAAGQLFPENREGQMLSAATLWREESDWSRLIRARIEAASDPDYFLTPLLNGWVSAPYLVGSYEHVAQRLRAYAERGYAFFLLDELRSPAEGAHFGRVLAALR